ncbi:MAG: hypothetical protein U0797_01005 [Gemmataceae bacterium]
MGAKLDYRRTKAQGWADYEVKEHEQVTGSKKFFAFDGNGKFLGMVHASQMGRLVRDMNNGRKVKGREVLTGVLSCPDSVRLAMKDKGLLATPKLAYREMMKAARPAIRELGKYAVAQTTKNGQKDYVKVNPTIVIGLSVNNRSLELEVSLNFAIANKAQDAKGQWRTVDFPKLNYAQAPAQAALHLALGRRLKKHGIMVIPHGKSVQAVGYQATTQAKQNIAAAGAQAAAAAAAVAQQLAQQQGKQVVDWRTALANLTGRINRGLASLASDSIQAMDALGEKVAARRAVNKTIEVYLKSGMPRFTEGTLAATAMQLATPSCRPAVVQKALERALANASKHGIAEVAHHPTGHRTFAPIPQLGAEQGVAKATNDAMARRGKPLPAEQAMRGVVAVNPHMPATAVQQALDLCGRGGLRFGQSCSRDALQAAAKAHDLAGRRVYTVGDGPRLSGVSNFSATGFLDSAKRVGHLRSLWLGIRNECWLSGSPLKLAGEIRRAQPRVPLKKGDLLIVTPEPDRKNARQVEALLKLAEKRGAKVVLDGPHAAQYQAMALNQKRGIHP